ncbi:hypothetical protein Droror1_Dr00022867 [Drosera rotundifolia]
MPLLSPSLLKQDHVDGAPAPTNGSGVDERLRLNYSDSREYFLIGGFNSTVTKWASEPRNVSLLFSSSPKLSRTFPFESQINPGLFSEFSDMPKGMVGMKAVVYELSPFQQKVMSGLWKDLPGKNWLNATLLVVPVVGTYSYAQWYKEQEKLRHQY